MRTCMHRVSSACMRARVQVLNFLRDCMLLTQVQSLVCEQRSTISMAVNQRPSHGTNHWRLIRPWEGGAELEEPC